MQLQRIVLLSSLIPLLASLVPLESGAAEASGSMGRDESSTRSLWRPLLTELPDAVVGVFHWEGATFGTYTRDGRIQLVDSSTSRIVRRITLASNSPPSGEVFPDPLLRLDDRLVHLSKASQELRLYDLTGKPIRTIDLASRPPLWISHDSNRYWVLGIDSRTRALQYEIYSKDA